MTAPQNNSNHPHTHTELLTLHCGNNAEVLKLYPDCHFDVIVTDPPYGIEFLGKAWDSHTGAVETWQQCLRVLKPGGHLLAFSAARTYHNLATNIESVGFEIRDQLMWIYSSGFPKAQDVGKAIQRRQGVKKTQAYKENIPRVGGTGTTDAYDMCKAETVCTSPEALQWAGWKTALKPGHEPIVMARKPMRGSTIDNVIQHGVGALNIDVSRIPFEDAADLTEFQSGFQHANLQKTGAPTFQGSDAKPKVKRPTGGADGLSRLEFGEREPIKYKDQYKEFVFGAPGTQAKQTDLPTKFEANPQGRYPSNVMGDIPDYQKYFYCPKVSRRERHVGFEQIGVIDNRQMLARMGGYYVDAEGNRTENQSNYIHTPTTGRVYVHGLTKIYEQWCQSHGIEIVPKRLMPLPGENGFKDIRDCLDKDWANKKKDPLSHRPTNPNGMYDVDGTGVMYNPNKKDSVGNNHPTVKPVALMRYLIQLVTPANSKVLDPFMGSGSTGMAACELGHQFVGIDLDPNYVEIARKRITGWCKTQTTKSVQQETATPPTVTDLFDDLFE